jgi:hypothetical protein
MHTPADPTHRRGDPGVVAHLDGMGALHLHQVVHRMTVGDAQGGALVRLLGQPGEVGLDRVHQRDGGIAGPGKLAETGADPVDPGFVLAGDGLEALQRGRQPGHGRLGEVDGLGELGNAVRFRRQGAEHEEGSLDRLDGVQRRPTLPAPHRGTVP